MDRMDAIGFCRGAEQTGFLGNLAGPLVAERKRYQFSRQHL